MTGATRRGKGKGAGRGYQERSELLEKKVSGEKTGRVFDRNVGPQALEGCFFIFGQYSKDRNPKGKARKEWKKGVGENLKDSFDGATRSRFEPLHRNLTGYGVVLSEGEKNHGEREDT